GEPALRARVAQLLCPCLPIGVRRGMPADRPGGYAGVGAQFELAGEQVLHAILVHDQHDQINRLAADLQSEASTFDSEECRSAPPFRRTATGHAAAIARTHN